MAPTARWCSVASEFSVLNPLNSTRLTPDGTGFTLEVGADSFWGWALRLLWLSLVAGLIAWILGHRATDSAVGFGLRIGFALGATVGSAWWLRRELWPRRGEGETALQLRWQEREQRWLLLTTSSPTTTIPGRLSVQLDLQRWMLLRFHPIPTNRGHGPTPWLAISQRDLHAHWHTLRCAVYATPLV